MSRLRDWLFLAFAISSSACASSEMDLARSPGDPAAISRPDPAPIAVLDADFDPATLAPPGATMDGGGHEGHSMPTESTAPSQPANDGAGAMYTCAHHPDVTAPGPGACPKCGMDLIKKSPATAPKPEPPKPKANPHEGMEGM